jgi:probable rRNA maturation factor
MMHFYGKKIPKKLTLLRFAKQICEHLPHLKKTQEISIVFVSNPKIRKMNRTFLKHDYPTDVITFPNERGGDIFISVDMANSSARSGNYSVVQELALLILHGLLHLLGYQDHPPKKRQQMFAKQRQLFRKINPLLAPPDHR